VHDWRRGLSREAALEGGHAPPGLQGVVAAQPGRGNGLLFDRGALALVGVGVAQLLFGGDGAAVLPRLRLLNRAACRPLPLSWRRRSFRGGRLR